MQKRLDALRKRFRALKVANFIITRFENFEQANLGYLCGYTGSNGVLLVTGREAHLITDGRYTNQAQQQVKDAAVHIYSGEGVKSVAEAFARELTNNREIRFRGRIGIEARNTSVEFVSTLRKAFPKSEIVETVNVIEMMSAVREEDEINAIRRACTITDKVFELVLPLVRPGVSELELSAEISYRHAMLGAERDAFVPIVASGPRSAMPHGIASTRRIENGDFLIFDIGSFVNGYASDVTRTFVVGKASVEQKKLYQTIQDAQQKALDAVTPGMITGQLDKLARDLITAAGYGPYFTHSLGHGLGHIVHAFPRVSANSKTKLEVGNVVTIEPGAYIPDFGGVRIEDDVVVTREGHEALSKFTKELIEL